jgi:DNA-binding beta-propeller fold protein YncE
MSLFAAVLLVSAVSQGADGPPDKLFERHCASCHGADRLGGIGPVLLPENLARLKRHEARDVILNGRAATPMPAHGDKLSPAEVDQLVSYIYTPLAEPPKWSAEAIGKSRIEHVAPGGSAGKPAYDADPLNLFVVVELGDHHITILDGDRLAPIARVPTRFALHGGPKFSPDGRYVYLASRDGWIAKFDLYSLKVVAEVRAGVNTRNLALSRDGRFVAVGNYLPHSVVILDARDLSPLKVIDTIGRQGKSSRVAAVYDAPTRQSFVAALEDIAEIWEITYDPHAEPIYEGFVHDYQHGEGLAVPGPFPPRRIPLPDILDDFTFHPDHMELVGAARSGAGGQVVNLDVRKRIATVELPGMPQFTSAISWEYRGRAVIAVPNRQQGVVSIIDAVDWKPIKRIETLGPGFFMGSHENSRYAWVDNFLSPRKDTIQVIDKQTLEVVKTLTPAPGKTAGHVEFTRDGRHALVSVWELDGAVVVYDANTFKEVKRLPMRKPSGKYNVHNKIARSATNRP